MKSYSIMKSMVGRGARAGHHLRRHRAYPPLRHAPAMGGSARGGPRHRNLDSKRGAWDRGYLRHLARAIDSRLVAGEYRPAIAIMLAASLATDHQATARSLLFQVLSESFVFTASASVRRLRQEQRRTSALLEEVLAGEARLDPAVQARVLRQLRTAQSPPAGRGALPDDLIEREAEVLKLIAQALNNREIASRLVITEATVKTHINNIFSKIGVRDRAQAVVYAMRHGLAEDA
jgi:ATP/maltotriose-dependent transcriptional regulator MalT